MVSDPAFEHAETYEVFKMSTPNLVYGNIRSDFGTQVQGVQYIGIDCEVSNHTHMSCLSQPGIGTDFGWKSHIGGRSGSVASATSVIGYAAPEIRAIVGTYDFVTQGGDEVSLYGAFFGGTTLLFESYGLGSVRHFCH